MRLLDMWEPYRDFFLSIDDQTRYWNAKVTPYYTDSLTHVYFYMDRHELTKAPQLELDSRCMKNRKLKFVMYHPKTVFTKPQ